MKLHIKRLYDEANTLFAQAKAILAEYEGKEVPVEKAKQVDQLFDQVDAKSTEAKRLERAAGLEDHFGKPATGLPAPQSGEGQKAGAADGARETKAAVEKFLRGGPAAMTSDDLKLVAKGGWSLQGTEIKALQADNDAAGGFLQADQFRAELLTKQREASAMRRIGRVLPAIPGGSTITPTQDSDLSDAAWTSEILTGAEDVVTPFGRRVLTPHPLAKRIKVSNTLMRSVSIDMEAWVRDNLAYKFSVPEENGFINGTGAGQPLGLLNTPSLPTYTTVTSTELHGNDIIDWAYALPARYSGNARILCNRAFVRKIRSLRSFATTVNADNYLWQPGLGAGIPNRILDWPYELSDRFDDGLSGADAWEANAVVAVIGDFSYYWIVDSLNFSLQRLVELYAEANQTGFIGRKETDGMAVLAEAFYALKIKA